MEQLVKKLAKLILVAPGQLTINTTQVEKIKKAGYGGCVLKSVVGEDENGTCSMLHQRKKATYIKTVYDQDDKNGNCPIIHWDGRGDTRNLSEYSKFAKEAIKYRGENFLIIASLLCHLPSPDEDFKKEEWIHTTKILYEAGYRIFEIDFCPALKTENLLTDKQNILRWYETVPSIIKSVSPEITVFPKLLNPGYELDFQLKMAESSVKGKADGLVIANRIFKKEYNCAHGGKELREKNLIQIKEIKKSFPEIPISATGGIYSGKHIFDYLKAGAQNVQILSYIMGKVNTPFPKKSGNKLEKVFHKLLFDPADGLVFYMLHGNQNIISV